MFKLGFEPGGECLLCSCSFLKEHIILLAMDILDVFSVPHVLFSLALAFYIRYNA